jgi:hypothetical protein
MLSRRWIVNVLLALIVPALLASCSKQEEAPRTRDQIFQAKLELPALYLTTGTHKRVIAPANKHVFIDPESGEPCMPALACNNPDCPAFKDGKPFVFIEDINLFVKPDKTLGHKPKFSLTALDCPECLKTRHLDTEKPEEQQRYHAWVHPYVLPETAEKMKVLDEEFQRRILYERSHQRAVAPAVPVGGPQPTRADPASRPHAGAAE